MSNYQKHLKRRATFLGTTPEELEAAEDFIDANLDKFFIWVEKNKFNEFATIKDRYESDLENYITGNPVELANEYKLVK